jgi:hypothetical protein
MIIDTLTFSNKSQGWTSRWTYRPEWMVGLNSSFYSFKNGNLYQHDINQNHTEFYGTVDGFSVTTIFNDAPTEVKMFKTLAIDGTTSMDVVGYTDLDDIEIDASQFFKKEGKWYAYIRRPQNQLDYELISTQGLGIIESIASTTITMDQPFSNVDQGDLVYKEVNGSVQLVGTITSISSNNISFSSFVNTPSVGNYLFVVKQSSVESYGAKGYYLNVELSMDAPEAANNHEVFALKSSIFKSFP